MALEMHLCSLIALFVFLVPTALGRICPSGALLFDQLNACFFFFEKSETWDDAGEICKSFGGGHLAAIRNAFENSFLTSNASAQFARSSNFWIGGHLDLAANQWSWVSGYDWGYTNWAGGQPMTGLTCATRYVREQTWSTENCSATMPFVCEMPTFDPPTPAPIYCPYGWNYFDGGKDNQACFMKLYGTGFTDAGVMCEEVGGKLASMHNEAENVFVTYVGGDGHIVDTVNDAPTIGAVSSVPFNFTTWKDGTPITYTNWAPGQPSLDPFWDEGCIGIVSDPIAGVVASLGQWVVNGCDVCKANSYLEAFQVFGNYICKRPTLSAMQLPHKSEP